MAQVVETVQLMLACNDYRNGAFEGVLKGVQLADSEILDLESRLVDEEDADELSGLDIVFDSQGKFFEVKSETSYIVPIWGRKSWVGNWCWDCVLVELPELVNFLNWLMQTNAFWCISGIDTLHDGWHNAKPFTEEQIRQVLQND